MPVIHSALTPIGHYTAYQSFYLDYAFEISSNSKTGHVYVRNVAPTAVQQQVFWQSRARSKSVLPHHNETFSHTTPQVLVFFCWLVCMGMLVVCGCNFTYWKRRCHQYIRQNDRTKRRALHPFFIQKCVQRKQTNTYGIVFSRCSLGRVGRFRSQPCPSNGPTATRQLV